MITTANLIELKQIIESTHANPHHVLGMHEVYVKVKNKEEKRLAVRAFIPQAKAVSVLNEGSGKQTEMKIVHYDGFFEAILKESEFFTYRLIVTDHLGNTYSTYDAYSFLPQISDMDLHLFNEGTHYEIYDKMGAHPKTVNEIQGVVFTVWAPNAKRVSVIGDFNNWDGRRHAMRTLGNSGVWEIFIPGLKPLDHYKYEIKTRHNTVLEKSDPFANFSELRPSTSSLVYDLNQYQWGDGGWMKKRETASLNCPMNIYEVHLGSWKRKEQENNRFYSYLELAEELVPYVKEMGYTHIELLPIEEHPFDGSWGYQVTGYYAPTSRYGNPTEFMYFVDVCHQNGIGVLLDWVPAHFPKDAHGLAFFDGTALYEHADPRLAEQKDWGTLKFNYGRKEVKNFLIGNAIFWLDKYHLDGLRVDAVASMLYLDFGCGVFVPNQYGGRENLEAVEFIKHMNSIIYKRYPGVLMIAEESTSWEGVSHPVEEKGLGFTLKWNMGWMNDFLEYVAQDSYFKKYHHNKMTFGMTYAYSEKFILVLSHDEVVHGKHSLLDKMQGDLWQKFANLRVSLGFMMGHPGKKLLFMGGEFGQFIEWDEKRSLDWFLLQYEHHQKTLDFVKALNHFYLENECLWHDDFNEDGFEWIQCDDSLHSIFTFYRIGKTPEDILVFACNFTPVPNLEYRMGVPFAGTYVEVFNSDSREFFGSGITNGDGINNDLFVSEKISWDQYPDSIKIKLPPLGFAVFKAV